MKSEKVATGKQNRKSKLRSTQAHLRISEIRDNTLVLKNNGVRAVLKTSSINFNLKSDEEQKATIGAYQAFLNSLEFPIQITVKSKKLDIDNYINKVKDIGSKQKNKLLQEQTYEYADYIQKLIEYADIMEKNFYVIIPYDSNLSNTPNKIQAFFQRLSPKDNILDIKKRHKNFDKYNKGLEQRVSIVKSGLEGCGLQVEEASTEDLIELFYNSYNPITSRTTKIKDSSQTSIEKDKENMYSMGTN